LIPEAQAILAATEQARRSVVRAEAGMVGRLVIGFTNTSIYTALPRILAEYRRQYPQVELVLRDNMLTPMQVMSLLDKQLDFGFLWPPIGDGEIDLLPIAHERLIVALPSQHPLTACARMDMKELSGEPFIVFSRTIDSSLLTLIFRVCHDAGFQPRIVQEAPTISTVIMLVSTGMGITLVPSSAQGMRMKGVVFRKIAGGGPPLKMALAWNRGIVSPIRDGFIKVSRAVLEDFPQMPP
jgi:DNA-binding transcriptional LysR family regulator